MIQARFIIEAQGQPKSYVTNVLKKHVEKLKNLDGIEVFDVSDDETEEVEKGIFSALTDAGVRAKDFETFFAALMSAGPTAVVLEEPESVEVEMREIQNVSNDIVQMFHAFAQANTRLRIQLKKMGGANKPKFKLDKD